MTVTVYYDGKVDDIIERIEGIRLLTADVLEVKFKDSKGYLWTRLVAIDKATDVVIVGNAGTRI